MMSLFWIVGIGLIIWGFWSQSQQSERANKYIHQRCEQLNLQLLNVARERYVIKIAPFVLETHYQFEFSVNGSDSFQGKAVMRGMRIKEIVMQPYPII